MNTTGEFAVEAVNQEVICMDQELFPNPWSDKQWLELNPDQNRIFTLRINGKLLGMALFGVVPGDDTAHLFKILVHPEQRGGTVSHFFWSNIVQNLTQSGMNSIYLEVESSNHRAIRFYEKNGFKLLRRNRAYYSSGEDALIMSMTL